MLEQDIVFDGDTLKKGSLLGAYFNSAVFSMGYILSILTDERSFLGAFFNAYVINLETGLESEVLGYDQSIKFLAPLPNFGLVAMFSLTRWMTLSGSFGTFFLNTQGINGTFNNIVAMLSFKPTKWLGLDIGYSIFDVSVGFPWEDFRTIIDYNYNGPSLGLTFRF
jgi:hypothetical protein